jgi:hypothetical protein
VRIGFRVSSSDREGALTCVATRSGTSLCVVLSVIQLHTKVRTTLGDNVAVGAKVKREVKLATLLFCRRVLPPRIIR